MNRTIQIANTKTQRRYTIETSATTLGELQDQMTAQGIDFSGMTFTEGISKTQLLTRDTQLPSNVMFKGQPTNNLILLLTNTNKQIASGAMERKDAYALVKELNLKDAILEGEGKNFTQVKTDVLESYINIARNGADTSSKSTLEEVRRELEAQKPTEEAPKAPCLNAPHSNTVEWFYDGIKRMYKENILYTDDVVVLASLLSELAARLKEAQPVISEDDINAMISGI